MNTDPRHRAWEDIHDLLPAGWHVGPATYEPGLHTWTVVARAPNTGRRNLRPPESLAGTGEDELAPLTDLVLALREYNRPGQMAALERRARLAFYRNAQGASRESTGAADDTLCVNPRQPRRA